uniref:Aspartate/glutamate/uridylate kinase domain-containing protein n=1 Tax=Zea mays TaxID=4577 RepID=A0A804QEB6_MAIZE
MVWGLNLFLFQEHIFKLISCCQKEKAKYVGQYRITDEDARKAAMDAAGRIRLTIEAKLSPGPPMLNLRRHGVIGRWHGLVDSIASGNFLGAKRRGVVNGIDYGFTGEVTKIDVSRIRERLDSDSIVVISNMGFSSSGDVLNCNTYEVATACALALEADKLICVVDGQVFDDHGRAIQYMSIEEADLLIRKRARQSDIAASYVKVVDEEGINSLHKGDDRPSLSPKAYINGYAASFRNGLGFNNGNGIYSGEQGFAIGGEERLSRSNGYLSELVAAAYVCHVIIHLFLPNVRVVFKEFIL